MAEQIKSEVQWKVFREPRPYVTVIGFAMDLNGEFPIFFRSDKVRSAKNAWSMPSGLHEIGLPYWKQFAIELKEELNLDYIDNTIKKIGFYEAIIKGKEGEDNWHWVLLLIAVRVTTLVTLKNKEPEKHSDVQIITVDDLYNDFMDKTWTQGLKEALIEYEDIIRKVVVPL